MKTNLFIPLTIAAVIFSAFISNIMAQNGKQYAQIKTVQTSKTINISADSLWNIISQPNISVWSTLLDSTEVLGEEVFKGVSWSKRVSVVNSKGHHESHEELIAYDSQNRIIQFASTHFPKFIISNQTHWKVINKGEKQSALQVSTIMEMKKLQAFFLKKTMLKAINKNEEGIFFDIKHYAEQGEISPSKKARISDLRNSSRTYKDYKEIKRRITSDTINVSADSLWAILREFDKVAEWTSTLKHSEGHGEAQLDGATCNKRECETNFRSNGKAVEELTLFSDEKKELAYELIEGAPGFVKYASNHWTVEAIGPNQSIVHMDIIMRLKKFQGFFLSKAIIKVMKKQVRIVQSELKIYAETGEVSEAKKKQLDL